MWYIQLIEMFDALSTAQDRFRDMQKAEGFLGGRLLHATEAHRDPRIMAFFSCDTDYGVDFPEGVKRVYIPEHLRKWLGIK